MLLDREKPLLRASRAEASSRIDESEMARINIEASAALERWIEIMRSDRDEYHDLVRRACRLPMGFRSARRDRSVRLLELADPRLAARLREASRQRCERRLAEVEAHPTRVLANAIINTCWRNGPVEDLHAGRFPAYSLLQRRITPSEERLLLRTTVNRFAQAFLALFALVREESGRDWVERVLPFHLAAGWGVTPEGWSLTERTREVRLPGTEPG